MLILYIKYYTANACRLMTKIVFAAIIPLARCDSHSILEEIKKFYTTNNIDIKKMVMFTSDGAAVMLGKRNGVAKSLKIFVPHIIEQHCVAHREDLEIDDAWSKVSLTQDMETLAKTAYTRGSQPVVRGSILGGVRWPFRFLCCVKVLSCSAHPANCSVLFVSNYSMSSAWPSIHSEMMPISKKKSQHMRFQP